MSKLALLGGEPVRKEPFPLYPTYGKEEEEAVLRVVRSNALCSQVGQEVETFEREFAEYNSSLYGVAVSNGTTALCVALAAAGIGVGDEVIVPPYTFVATASAVVTQNAVPIFADIETDSLGLDPKEVHKKITPRTKAIIPVHMNGYPCDMDALLKIAKEHDLIVVEDCSHAHGAEYHGKKVGTLGDLGTFSFQHKKNMSLGEGGIVITSNPDYAEKMRNLRSFGHEMISYNYRMPELQAAIGRVRLAKLDEMNQIRRENAEVLRLGLSEIESLSPLKVRDNCNAVYYNYVIRYSEQKTGVLRSKILDAIKAEGIPIPFSYTPLNIHPIFRNQNAFGHNCPFKCPLYQGNVDYSNESYPVTESTCNSVNLDFKIHPPCNEKDMLDIIVALKKVLDNIGELL